MGKNVKWKMGAGGKWYPKELRHVAPTRASHLTYWVRNWELPYLTSVNAEMETIRIRIRIPFFLLKESIKS